MKIIHPLNSFFYSIFPELKDSNDQIISYLTKYYTYQNYVPKIEIKDDVVIISIDIDAIAQQTTDFKKVIALCEKGNFKDAKPILLKLLVSNPTVSEYHRILGQILSEEGKQDDAIDYLIDALRWDSKNSYALIMLGNIFAKFKNDIATAKTYYDQALIANPNDHISINNIGANLLQQGKFSEAEEYFFKAVKINDEYPNTHFALSMIAIQKGDVDSAFYSVIKALKFNKNRDVLHQNSLKQAFDIAKAKLASNDGKKIFRQYRSDLEKEGKVKIDIVEDANISTAAKMEFAENYDRNSHIVRFNPQYPAIAHLIMHELVHLDLVLKARAVKSNQLVVSNNKHKELFVKDQEQYLTKLYKRGLPEKTLSEYITSLFNGLNVQAFNAPIDLFIEDFLYTEYPELRPYQFISLYKITKEGLEAVTKKEIVELSAKDILSKSKIYNIVGALQFKELYGIDMIADYKATPIELKTAKDFYEEYKEYNEDREPGEEYELVAHWAEDLKLNKYFDLVGELQYRKGSSMETFLTSFESDPFGVEDKDPVKEREMKKFLDGQAEIGTNMAVVMFMVDALQFFKGMPAAKIKEIAFEIAMQGTQGYDPEKKSYKLSSIPDKVFSGYHILAYYFVSWSLAIPEMVAELHLPYDKEYQLALTLANK